MGGDMALTIDNSKVQAKLNSQQDRLKYLDNYRIICEKRIRDLAPSHPLPVLPSHCGQPNPDLEELKTRLRMNIKDENGNLDIIKTRSLLEQLN